MAPEPRSAALQRFLDSMILDIDKWRDGEPYDLDALRAITPDEHWQVLSILEERLADSRADWRDVDAVAALATPDADVVLERCASHADPAVRLRAAPHLASRGHRHVIQKQLLGILLDPHTTAPIDATMRLAEQHPTAYVKDALLDCAIRGAPHLRVHAAALALYLAGGAKEPFDWDHRPLFLQFGEEEEATRAAAMSELRALMNARRTE
jgi:hypothetical protein